MGVLPFGIENRLRLRKDLCSGFRLRGGEALFLSRNTIKMWSAETPRTMMERKTRLGLARRTEKIYGGRNVMKENV